MTLVILHKKMSQEVVYEEYVFFVGILGKEVFSITASRMFHVRSSTGVEWSYPSTIVTLGTIRTKDGGAEGEATSSFFICTSFFFHIQIALFLTYYKVT